MITLSTGLNGAGKGVFTIDFVIKKAKAENRTVYYNGIRNCTVPGWIELKDPRAWTTIPPGSIFVQDEAQEPYPQKLSGDLPPYIRLLARHREQFGIDMFFMTPHPMSLHPELRRLVAQHFFCVRKFGKDESKIHEFNKIRENCDKNSKGGIDHDYVFNKEIYGLYTSAPAHTGQGKRPFKYYLMFIFPLVAIAALYGTYLIIKPIYQRYTAPETVEETVTDKPEQTGFIRASSKRTKEIENLTYIQAHTPELPDFPQTAPAYKELTKPENVPYPAACVAMGNLCKCYTQQGTKLKTSDAVCHQIVENGFFIEWKQETGNTQQTVSNNQQVYPARDVDRDFTNSSGIRSRGSPNNAPPT